MVATVALLLANMFNAHPAAAAVNDFTITNYIVDMELGRDSEGRSTLRTVETIRVDFPMTNQNHGLERMFVKTYDGHSLSLQLESVTDENSRPLNYHWEGDALRIGDADTYVHGLNTYVITYTMRDVTKLYEDTARDEFYWDAIGLDWRVPIEMATVRLTLAPEVREATQTEMQCYTGIEGSTEKCQTSTLPSGSYGAVMQDIGQGRGATVAIGFSKGTFTPYQRSLFELLLLAWIGVQIVAGLIGFVALIRFIASWYSRLNRSKEIKPIIPEYIPPKGISVTASARVYGTLMGVQTAQMLDLAVRHYIKIYESKPKKGIFSSAEYEIEIIRDPSDLLAEEQEILKDMFGSLPSVGERLGLKTLQNNTAYYQRTLNNDSALDTLIRESYNLRAKDEPTKQWARRWAKWSLAAAILLLSPMWLIVALIAYGMSFSTWRLTDSGLALKRYLEGLKMYIGVAETERLNMMQSPEGAEKVRTFVDGDPTGDPKLLIKLYERVLPYAVLFGQEKKWNAELGKYYETANTQPDWYAGNAAFNAAVFTSAMSSFSSASNYASSSSSSSGGSSGGGFSGGGGGGGGGGGW